MANLPGKAFKLVYEDAGISDPTKVTVVTAPAGSTRVGTVLRKESSTLSVYLPGSPYPIDYRERRTFEFAPDLSGVYELEFEFPTTPNALQTIEVATKLTRRVSLIEFATLHVWVQDGSIVSVYDGVKSYPYLSTMSPRGAFAAQTPSVKAALSALVGGTDEPRLSAALASLESAWTAALASPTTVDGQSLAVASLVISGGWSLAATA